MPKPKPPVGPKLTWKEIQERTDLTATDGRKYHAELPATWDNAEWCANNPDSVPPPHFLKGHEQNQKLKAAIAKAFNECKEVDPADPDGPPWLLAWRMYPNADHPLWKSGMNECGCNCGCYAPRVWDYNK